MHASSLIVVVGLGALAAHALPGGVDTVVDTTVITVTACGPEVTNCPEKISAGPTTEEVTETSTYCPPTETTPAPVVPASSTPAAAIPSSTSIIVVPSSITVSVSELPSTTQAPTSAPVVPVPVVGNSTLIASSLYASESSILIATGSPSLPATTAVRSPTPKTESASATSSTATPSATGAAAGRVAVPGLMLGLLAASAYFFG